MAVQGLSQQAMTQVQKVHSATAVNILSVGGQGVKHNLHITPIAVGDCWAAKGDDIQYAQSTLLHC